ncbi:MAG: serine hydrolase [Acidobacteria bacterium]|nr:serine hydrolase [Acidobacteriota bacterium]MYG74723.1 serine hydrolase [Acidobacteriota bacterium]
MSRAALVRNCWAVALLSIPPAASAEEPSETARRVLAGLTLEAKVGQVLMPRAPAEFRNLADPERRELLEMAESGRLGGVVVFAGSPGGTRGITTALQDAAPLPVLVAADYEWGTPMRTAGGVRFPPAMQAAAAPDPAALERQGRIVAREARAVGVHLVLAPVLDVLQSPSSAVIGTRSFGSDPDLVRELGVAFLRGVEAGGALATAKHFPGHGGTGTDSHRGLALVPADREHLDAVDLAPFRAAVAAGVSAVMPGHLAVPALDGREDRPAVLSPEMLDGLLRSEMGFTGLVVSDALEMEGARAGRFDGEVAAAALGAGVDVILVPRDPVVAYGALIRAVRAGRLAEARLDEAVLRVLEAKARLGLFDDRAPPEPLTAAFGDPASRDFAEPLFARGLTLVRDPEGLLPWSTRITGNQSGESARTPRLLLVETHQEGPYEPDRRFFRGALRRRGALAARIPTTRHGALPIARFAREAESADAVVVADFRKNGLEMPEELLNAVTPFAEKLVVVSFGNPHGVRNAPPEAGILLAWDGARANQEAAAGALFGESALEGRLPVPLEGQPVGAGVSKHAERQRLRPVEPGEVGMSPEGVENIRAVIEAAIANGVTPGASTLVAHRGRVLLHEGFGRLTYDEDAPAVTPETIYDLASLTKVVGTTTLVMMLVEEDALDIALPVSAYLPEFLDQAPSVEERARRAVVTVSDLLAHSSGLPAWIQFYLEFDPEARGLPLGDARRMVFDRIVGAASDYEPRTDTVYSDNGILLLGEIIERVSGKRLDVLVRERIFDPLGMTTTRYRPPLEWLDRIAPTEDNPWRGRVVRGQVHDENTVVLGEVAAHAGLFSTTGDLGVFLQMLLNGGSMNGERLLRARTIARFTKRAGLAPGSSRALGWDTPSRTSSGGPSSAGDHFSASSFGHTGFTGTSIWVDAERELFAVLLTNRVYPTRENDGILRLRPAFHDAVSEALGDGR